MEVSSLLSKYNKEFWDFNGVKKEGVHILGKYPATMVAPMQYELLSILVNNNSFKTLLDPFMGSATTLVEGHNLGLDVLGIDINPYAVLLGEVKTHRYCENELLDMNNRVKEKLYSLTYSYELYEFQNIKKWFRIDIIDSLSKIRTIIMEESDIWIRKFLWICLSEVIYSYSNDRTSTFKLHIKTETDIATIKNNCINSFDNKITKNQKVLITKEIPDVNILNGDSISLLKDFSNNSIDIICTSPPYGDNATTVTYGQASILFLKWIDFNDLSCDEELLSNYSKIDTVSLGGSLKNVILPNSSNFHKYVSKLSENKKGKVIRFISDYYKVLTELSRVLSIGGYMLFTVGNRRVDGILQPLDRITEDIFSELGLRKEQVFTRNILSKKMPSHLSNVNNNGSVKSMNKETVLIYKKEK
ncbi:DNA methyltransferase [Enterococcus casseliflavus]|uniref:DNA methyltransferase n=1 Tax=Enterococcus casseliflavus TaxID=37734 RepID=UPI0018837B23|nr:DNA methyltransferase [Enterococcus casseliflavus]MBE9908982.1 site-specific DNA-methyltransferase [Enterococcus casseliflavus]